VAGAELDAAGMEMGMDVVMMEPVGVDTEIGAD
jgi:hypothetical protein